MNPIEKFLNTYSSERTKNAYKSHLKVYFEFLNTDPEKYFTTKRNYIEDLTKWLDYNQNKAPLTKSKRMSCIRLFLEDNDIDIPKKIWKQFQRKQKANKPIILDRIPTNQELKKILEHSDVKARSLVLVLSSSGMRIDELMNLEPDDIDFKSNPPKVYVRHAKFKKPRICFISNEAKNSLLEWLKVRDKFLVGALNKCNRENNPITHKNPDDNRIFPFTYQTFAHIWHRMLKDAKLNDKDKSTGFHRLHIHTLRKYYKTKLLNAGMTEAKIRMLMGQEDPLGNSYNRFSEDDLKSSYKKYVKSLLVFETEPDLTGLHEQMEEKDKQIKEMQDMMQEMKAQILELRLEKLEKANGIKR